MNEFFEDNRIKKLRNTVGERVVFGCCIFALIAYVFRNVNQGIDIFDGGYHFSNFLYMDSMDPMWLYSTYLSNLIGHFLTEMPKGNTLLGINIYTAIFVAVLITSVFSFFVKVLKIDKWSAWLGSIISLSLCWCPTTALYNYLTYLLFNIAAIIVYISITDNKPKYLFVAGLCLGFNVFVRFPNIVEVVLVLVIWGGCYLYKRTIKECMLQTLYSVAGFLVACIIMLIEILIRYEDGISLYVHGILRLFQMPTYETTDLYGLTLSTYLQNGRWIGMILFIIAIGILIFSVSKDKYIRSKGGVLLLGCMLMVAWMYKQEMFTVDYYSYDSICEWSELTLIIAIVLACANLVNRKNKPEQRVLSMIILIIIAITPIGSNNLLYSNFNNMFLIMPYVIGNLGSLLKSGLSSADISSKMSALSWKIPVALVFGVCVTMTAWQSIRFGNAFVYGDYTERPAEVTSIPALAGMKTSTEKAKILQELGEYVYEAGISGEDVLLCGNIPGLSAYLRMPFVINSWPDLASYSCTIYEDELVDLYSDTDREKPIIILDAKYHDLIVRAIEDYPKEMFEHYPDAYKEALVRDLIKEHNYTCTFENDAYVIFE